MTRDEYKNIVNGIVSEYNLGDEIDLVNLTIEDGRKFLGWYNQNNIKVEDLIIEDLGDIREETIALRKHYGFTRQKILQFALELWHHHDKDNEHENVVIFPGNHDCQTIHGWYKKLNDEIEIITPTEYIKTIKSRFETN